MYGMCQNIYNNVQDLYDAVMYEEVHHSSGLGTSSTPLFLFFSFFFIFLLWMVSFSFSMEPKKPN